MTPPDLHFRGRGRSQQKACGPLRPGFSTQLLRGYGLGRVL